jgi:RNA polymerase sigma-70 factor (ECF subfamily)
MPNEVESSQEIAESPDPVFSELLRRMRAGCPDAAQELFARYHRVLRVVVRRRLHRRLRTLYDSLDFVQSVWASFLQAPPAAQHLQTPRRLEAYLTRIAANKVIEVYRQRMQTGRRDMTREEGLDNLREVSTADPRAPTGSQLAIAEEHWELLRKGQTPQICELLELLRQGHTHAEVARRLQLHPKMIQRLLHKLRQRLSPG